MSNDTPVGEDKKPTEKEAKKERHVRVELFSDELGLLKDLELDKEVTLTIKGKIHMVRQGKDWTGDISKGEVSVTPSSVKLDSSSNMFSELADEESK